MKAYRWEGYGDYQYFLVCTGAETVSFVNHLGPYAAKAARMDDEFYFLLSTARRAVAPLPHLALAFGGMHDESPIGQKVDAKSVLPDLRLLHLEQVLLGRSAGKRAYQWMGNDGYQFLIACAKDEAAEIIRCFGQNAKGPTLRMADGRKYSFYLLNTFDQVITPVRHLSWIFGSQSDPYQHLLGKTCPIEFSLEFYQYKEYSA